MKNITNEILEEIKQSDFSSEDLKTIQGIFENFDISSLPNLKPTEKKVRKKIEREIENREEKEKIDFIKNLPRFAKWRLRLTGFVSAFVIFLFLFVSTFFSNFFTGKIIVEENVISLEDQSFTEFKKAEVSPTLGGIGGEDLGQEVEEDSSQLFSQLDSFFRSPTLSQEEIFSSDATLGETKQKIMVTNATNGIITSANSEDNQIYSFLYDGKGYPKLKEKLPVYQNNGALINKTTEQQNLNSLKIGNLSLKDLAITEFDDITVSNNNYTLNIHFKTGKASLITHGTGIKKFSEIPNERTLKKRIKSKCKAFGIDLEHYGEIILEHQEDEHIYFHFPFLVENKEVFYPSATDKIAVTMQGNYNALTDEIDLYNINLSQYKKSSYPLISEEEVKEKLITGGDFYHDGMKTPYSVGIKVSAPKIVYLYEEPYYIPALQFEVNTEDTTLETKTSVLYVQLIQ